MVMMVWSRVRKRRWEGQGTWARMWRGEMAGRDCEREMEDRMGKDGSLWEG